MINNFNKTNNYKVKLQDISKKLGPPLFAKMIILFIIGVALSVAFGNLYYKRINTVIQRYREPDYKKVYSARKINQGPTDAQSLHLRAKSLIKKGNFKAAEIEAQRTLQVDSSFYKAYMDLGVVYSSYGDYIKAEGAFKSALNFIGNKNPDFEIIYADLGLIYYVERRPLESWEYFRKAYEMKAHLGNDFWSDPRLKYIIENEKNKFIEQVTFDKRLPREISQRKRRIQALFRSNNNEAIRDCEQFLSDNPGSVYAYVFRSLIVTALLNENQYEKAIEQLKIVESESLPDNYVPWVKHTYAYIYDKKGETQKAINYLKEIISNYPNYASIGEVKEMLKKIEDR